MKNSVFWFVVSFSAVWSLECWDSTSLISSPDYQDYHYCFGTENFPFTWLERQFSDLYRSKHNLNGCIEKKINNMDQYITKVEKLNKKFDKTLEFIKMLSLNQYKNGTLMHNQDYIHIFIPHIERVKQNPFNFTPTFFFPPIAIIIDNFHNCLKEIPEIRKTPDFDYFRPFSDCQYYFFKDLEVFYDFSRVLRNSELTSQIKYQMLNANYCIVERGNYTGKLHYPDAGIYLPQLTNRISGPGNDAKNNFILPTISDMLKDFETRIDLVRLLQLTVSCFELSSSSNETIKKAKMLFQTESTPILLKISEKFFSVLLTRAVDNIHLIMIDLMNWNDSDSFYLPELKQLIFDFMAKHGYLFFPTISTDTYIYDPLEIKQDLIPILKVLQEIFMDEMVKEQSRVSLIYTLLPFIITYVQDFSIM